MGLFGRKIIQETILFNSYHNPVLSAFHPMPVKFDGRTYPCIETCYQCQKFDNKNIINELKHLEGAACKKSAAHYKNNIIDGWMQARHHIMEVVAESAYEQNAVEQCLLSLLYGVKLVHLSPWDTFWGQDNRGKGTNVYGKLLMRLSSRFSRTSFSAKVEREAQYILHTEKRK